MNHFPCKKAFFTLEVVHNSPYSTQILMQIDILPKRCVGEMHLIIQLMI